MSERFVDKVIVITGAYGGIGTATAAQFAKEGANLVLAGRNKDKLLELADKLNISQNRYLTISCDVSREEDVTNMLDASVKKFGKLDVLFNNAGIVGKVDEFQNFTSEDMHQVLDINVMGVFYGMKHALKIMQSQGYGVIINTSSVAGYKGQPNTVAYVASKHAITGLTRAAAAENVRKGIRVCCICPAPVDTNMMNQIENDMSKMMGINKNDMHDVLSDLPAGRYAKPEEIASAVLFLASDAASYITGTSLFVDGGFIGF